ncbi:MAG: ion transporter [Candidatus Lindowbacteria bacterium]|nr:ion transporter [Candidatus Lindowbacteria bacterium]
MSNNNARVSGLRRKLQEIIFEADTPTGSAFDTALFIAIAFSVATVCLESVSSVRAEYGRTLRLLEWFITILFTVEYALRLYCVGRPLKYATSFFGMIDFLAILPSYLGLLFVGTHTLSVVRAVRLLRIFRVFKLGHFLGEATVISDALRASSRKIAVFLFAVLNLVLILGAVMYMIEGEQSGFTSIPQSVYWAIVTLTTVGYGDIIPQTALGKFVASIIMITGYGIIAVPTGIVTAEFTKVNIATVSTQACPECSAEGHTPGAAFCNRCGENL